MKKTKPHKKPKPLIREPQPPLSSAPPLVDDGSDIEELHAELAALLIERPDSKYKFTSDQARAEYLEAHAST